MPIKLICRCGRNLLVPEERAGRILACPKCNHKMMVPGERKRVEEPVSDAQLTALAESLVARQDDLSTPPPSPVIEPVKVEIAKTPPLKKAPATPPPLKKEVAAPAPEPLSPFTPPVPEVEFQGPVVSTAALKAMPASVAAAMSVAPAAKPTPAPGSVASAAKPSAGKTKPLPKLETERIHGYLHDADKIMAAYLLATLVALLAVVGMVPAGIEIARFVLEPDGDPIGRYAYVLLFCGLLQMAYAMYLAQMPDWSTSWVLTGVALLQAGVYAAALSSLHLSKGQSPLVPWFDLGPHIDNGHATAWCFIMLLLASANAYFCGRVSMRWRRAFQLVRTAYGR